MITSLADHLKRKEEQENYDQLVNYFCNNLNETAIWRLTVSISNNVRQGLFSSSEASELASTLCTEFGIGKKAIEYLKTFSSDSVPQEKAAPSKVIQISSKQKWYRANNERLLAELSSALSKRAIEYRQALDLVSEIIENYPATAKQLLK